MARIGGVDTKPEVLLRRVLWALGWRYRLGRRVLGVRPDLVFVGLHAVVFVDGCFWHGCPDHYVPPRSRRGFWEEKLRGNVERDVRQTRELEEQGWMVIRVWEHEVWRGAEVAAARVAKQLESRRVLRTRVRKRVLRVEFLDAAGERERRHLVDLWTGEGAGCMDRKRSTKKF